MLNYNNHFEKIEKVKNGELNLRENVNSFLNRIEENKDLNAFNFVFDDVLNNVDKIQTNIKNNNHGKLAGMVIAVKDVISIKDKPMTCSSKILSDFKPIYTATAIQRLIDEEAIIIGKTNCDEFAMGSSNENSAFGNVKNPIDTSRVPGGSSGGSAAAVAATLCDVSIGTDTGGSIRQPAAFCGTYGLKPTYGLVSRYGLTAFASSFDSIGPFANSIEDIAKVLEVISGNDKFDSTSTEIEEFTFNTELDKNIKIGIPREYFAEGLDSEIKDSINENIDKLKSAGCEIIDIELPHTEHSIATYYILTDAEASSNLSRFDGVRFGLRTKEKDNLNNMYTATRSEAFGDEVKRRIMLGTYVLSSGYYDAFYKKAQKVRRLIQEDLKNALSKVDIILTPTTPSTAFKIGENIDDPLKMYLNDIYTTSANLAGMPALNIPVGNDSNGLPIGMQVLADHFQESKLLKIANLIKTIN